MAEPEEHEGVAVGGRAAAVFGDGGEIGLVLDQHGRGQPLLEHPHQPPVPGGQPGGVAQFAGDRVDQSGRADADAVQRTGPGLARGAFQQGGGLFGGGLGVGVAADGQGRLGQRGAEQIGDDHRDAPGAYVEGGEMGAVGGDPVQPGVGAAAPGTGLADHTDQTGALQPFDEVGDGGPGEAGQGLQLRGRQRTVLLEQSQGEPVVDGPCGAR